MTVEDIVNAVRHAGYVPDASDNGVSFMVAGETFFIEMGRLPQIVIGCCYNVIRADWDMPLLKHAAHVMSDEMIMVKALFDDRTDVTVLHFFVVAMGRNYESFCDNLMAYLEIVRESNRRMIEIYDQLVEEKKNTATMQQDSKLLS